MHRACHDLALDLLYRQPKHGEQIRETGEMKMSIQKKSLIGNLTAAKKAITAALASAGAVEASVLPGTINPGAVRPGAVRPGAVRPGAVRPGAVRPGTMR